MEVILNNQRLETDVFLGSHNNSVPPTQELFPEYCFLNKNPVNKTDVFAMILLC